LHLLLICTLGLQGCSAAAVSDALLDADSAQPETGRPSRPDSDDDHDDDMEGDLDQPDVQAEGPDADADGSVGEPADAIAEEVIDAQADTAVADALADSTPDIDDNSCGSVTVEAQSIPRPIDMIWVIDTSGSMDEEVALVELGLIALASYVETSGLDLRVIMLADATTVCPPVPLTDGACPPGESAIYIPSNTTVGSFDALVKLIENFSGGTQYSRFLRPDAVRHIIVVSDDESDDMTADAFLRQAAALPAPGLLTDMYFHSIVSETEEEDCFLFICETVGCSGRYGDAESRGDQYLRLSDITGGVVNSICEDDWAPIFDAISERVVETSQLPCAYEMPETPTEGDTIAFETIEVQYEVGGVSSEVPRVPDEAACDPVAGGWFFNDPANPTQITLCPSSCDETTGAVTISGECRKQ
jgi:hypothetical protein